MGQRHVLALMLFLALLVGYAERAVLPMAIIRMVHTPNVNAETAPLDESVCPAPAGASSATNATESIEQAVIEVIDCKVLSGNLRVHVWGDGLLPSYGVKCIY